VKNKKKTKTEIGEVINYVIEYGGLEYAELKMNQYRDKALAILDSYPDSEIKESLREFVQYTTSRKK
jgi:octaprenyl-diphosphate synthase